MNSPDSISFPKRHSSRRSLFEDTVDILHFLEVDRNTPHVGRLLRDRQIGQGVCESALDNPLKMVRCWWQRAGKPLAKAGNEGEKAARVRTLVSLAAAGFGFLSGLGVILAVFQYDGSHPINVVTLIAVFVILQVLLISMSLLMLLPVQNFMGNISETVNPAAMLLGVIRRTLPRFSSRAKFLEIGTEHYTREHHILLRWHLFSWSQLMGCAFNIGALLGALLLIVFTDLAFGWSSTLMLESAEFQKLVHFVSMPWSSFWADALPSQLLIEQSRFYRLEAGPATEFAAQNLTAWWPFVLACIITYGLLPRAVLLFVGRIYLHGALVKLLTDNSQVLALLDRMRIPQVVIASAAHGATEAPVDDEPHIKPDILRGKVPLVIWSESADRSQLLVHLKKQYNIEVSDSYRAGGLCTMSEDQITIKSIGKTHQTAVIIIVKSWEPPLNDLLDFVSGLRKQTGNKLQIILLLTGPGLSVAETQHLRIWRHALGKMSDSQVYVEFRLQGSDSHE